ncbi:MAG: asparagine--tRNA ligase [Syntrophomonadaceae bacterium]|jgi:asparaginyl-tRNA synthetase
MGTEQVIRYLYEVIRFGEDEEKAGLPEIVNLKGWVRTNRNSGSIGFIELNDGTFFRNAQIVYYRENNLEFDPWTHISLGSAIEVVGKLVLTPDGQQPFEVQAMKIAVLGDVESDYPLQKKRHSFEFLRDISHLRPRTNTFNAIYRLRHVLSMAIHSYFDLNGFVYVHTPILTGNDAEGAGQAFKVVTGKKNSETDFFGKPTSLTVSGQLHVEAFALAFRDVYTFGPTFRAEESNTPRHAAEFWMLEPEIAFADLEDLMDLIEDCLKYCINFVLESAPEEMAFFNKFIDKNLLNRLENLLEAPFKRMTYTEAVDLLLQAKKKGHKFEDPNIFWGMDLQGEHERYLTDKIICGPVFVTDYPAEIKAFYMRLNDDQKTVAACDLLVPDVGELVGGSQREERYDVLRKKMEEQGNVAGLEWYLDLRRYGGVKHGGFGLGFDRFMMYLTGMSNIRDVQPYARNYGNIRY